MFRVTLFCAGDVSCAVEALRRVSVAALPAFDYVVSDGSDESSDTALILAGHDTPVKFNKDLCLDHAVELAKGKGAEAFARTLENSCLQPLCFYRDQEPDGDDFNFIDIGTDVRDGIEDLVPDEGNFHLLVIGDRLPILALIYSIGVNLGVEQPSEFEKVRNYDPQYSDVCSFLFDDLTFDSPIEVDFL